MRREWANARRLEANEKFYEELLDALRRDRSRRPAGGRRKRSPTTPVKRRGRLGLVLLAMFAPGAFAHEVRPAYLELRQTGAGDLRRAVEGAGARREPAPRPLRGAAGAAARTSPRRGRRWSTTPSPSAGRVKCAGGSTGGTIHIAGLTATMTDVLVRLERLDGTTQVTRLTPSAPSFVVEAAPRRAARSPAPTSCSASSTSLPGIDHLLFVLALLIITRRAAGGSSRPSPPSRVAHSLTLVGGDARLRARAATAGGGGHRAEHRLRRRGDRSRCAAALPGITARAPWVVALHLRAACTASGLPAGSSEAGLPPDTFPRRSLFFNLGVETGHFLFIGVGPVAPRPGAPCAPLPFRAWARARASLRHRRRGDVLGHSAHHRLLSPAASCHRPPAHGTRSPISVRTAEVRHKSRCYDS